VWASTKIFNAKQGFVLTTLQSEVYECMQVRCM